MKTHESINFLPDDFRGRKSLRKTVALGTAMIVLATGASAMGIIRSYRDLDSSRRTLAAVEQTFDATSVRLTAEHARREQQKKLVQRATSIATLIDTVPRSSVLAELTNHLPDGASLIDITLDTRPKPETASASQNPDAKKIAARARQTAETTSASNSAETEVALRITGLAQTDLDVAHYLSELSHSPVFREVSLLISEEHRPSPKTDKIFRRFQMQITVNADARLVPSPQIAPAMTADIQSAN